MFNPGAAAAQQALVAQQMGACAIKVRRDREEAEEKAKSTPKKGKKKK